MPRIDYKTYLIWLSTDNAVPPDGEEVIIADSLDSDDFYTELDCGSTNVFGVFKWDDPDLSEARAWMRPSFPCDQKATNEPVSAPDAISTKPEIALDVAFEPVAETKPDAQHERSLDDVRKDWLKSPMKKRRSVSD